MTDFVPNARVEVAFTSGYATPAASRVWTDITEWVRFGDGLSITRGRQDEAGDIDASALAFTVDNRDGRFTPGRVSSPYWPNVKKGRPVRVVYTWAGVEYVRFTGYVDSWPVSWSGGTDSDAEVSVSASSRFARLASGAELRTVMVEEFARSNPLNLWTLSEEAGAVAFANALGDTPLAPGLMPAVGVTPTTLAADSGFVATFGPDSLVSASSQALQAFVEFYVNPIASGPLLSLLSPSGGLRALLTIDGSLNLSFGVLGGSFAGTLTAGQMNHVVVGVTGGSAGIYVNGTLVSSGPVGGAIGTIGTIQVGGGGSFDLSYLATYTTGPAVADIARRAALRSASPLNSTVGNAIETLASYIPVAVAEVDATDGATAQVARFETAGGTPLSLMQDLSATDGGRLYDARDGKLAFRGRDSYWNPTPAFTLSALLQEVEASLSPILDDQGMLNDVGGVRAAEGATPYRATNAASVAEYGPYRADVSLLTTSDYDVTGTIWWLVNQRGEPRVRLPQVEVAWEVLDNTTTKAAILEADLGAVFTLTDLPEQAPAPELRLTIEGYAETLTATELRFSFNTTDASPLYVFTLDSDSLGRLDSDTRLAY